MPLAPSGTNGPSRTASHGLRNTMSRASDFSSRTAFSSSSSLSISSMSTNTTVTSAQNPLSPGPIMASNNIINQRADASRSLYQICVNLRQRLAQVPGFDQHLNDSDDEDQDDENMDPVSSLWRCLRKGYPLMTIYNSLQPVEPLVIDEARTQAPKRAKMAAFKFVQACLKDLNLPSGECFVISDLFGNDTTGFVKVSLSFLFFYSLLFFQSFQKFRKC